MALQLLISLTGKNKKRLNGKLAWKKYANHRKGTPGVSLYFPLFSFLLGNLFKPTKPEALPKVIDIKED